ncbi:APC family permease [Mesorhizobium koreense]|uniref:APC family permease n=1 Tax=Mesorhizobium koreense TaxID=3074855 RepID=UPI00287BAD03|nr:APC family permease [Mesorhizobium sp. WR6]
MAHDTAVSAPNGRELRSGVLGTAAIVFLVTSAAAPMAAIAGSGSLAMLLGNGAGAAGAYVLAALCLLVFSVGYTAMARHVSEAGGFFSFTLRAGGMVPAGATAYLAFFGYNALQIGIYGLFGAACEMLFAAEAGLSLPWWVYSALALPVVGALGYRQIDVSAKVLGVLVLLEFIVVCTLDAVIVGKGGPAGSFTFAPLAPQTVLGGSLSIALLFAFSTFVGFEATTIYSEEAKDPETTIPRATYISVLLIGGFYAFTALCMIVGGGVDRVGEVLGAMKDPTDLLFVLGYDYLGENFTRLMRVLFVTSVFASLLAFHNNVGRYALVLARHRLLPETLNRTHPVHQSPHLGSLLQSVIGAVVLLAFVVAGAHPILALFSWLINTGTLAIVTAMIITSFSIAIFFRSLADARENRPTTVVLPCLAGTVLAIIGGLAAMHFDILVGVEGTLAVALPALVLLTAALGALVGWLRTRQS